MGLGLVTSATTTAGTTATTAVSALPPTATSVQNGPHGGTRAVVPAIKFVGLMPVTFFPVGASGVCRPGVCAVHLPGHLRPRAVRDHVGHPHQPHHAPQPDADRPDRAGPGHVTLGRHRPQSEGLVQSL